MLYASQCFSTMLQFFRLYVKVFTHFKRQLTQDSGLTKHKQLLANSLWFLDVIRVRIIEKESI